jgi:tetratricopeptide (TPR) repeat protein
MKNISLKIFAVTISVTIPLIISSTLLAKPYIPESPDAVISNWGTVNHNNQQKDALGNIRDLINQANIPGNNYLYSIAESKIDKHLKTITAKTDEAWLLKAQIQQYNHEFNAAKDNLKKALSINSQNDSALLMLSRLQILEKNYKEAKKTCIKLIGISDITTSSVCLFEAESYLGNTESSYKKLKNLAETTTFNTPEYKNWVYLLLADISNRLNQPQESERWLDKGFDKQDINFIIHWADQKLAVKKFTQTYKTLSTIVSEIDHIEDSILLRLAIAEKNIAGQEGIWQHKIKERIHIREQRQDTVHASDIAKFYIHINSNPEKAVYWAQINWQQVQEPRDKQLLEQAVKLAGKQS